MADSRSERAYEQAILDINEDVERTYLNLVDHQLTAVPPQISQLAQLKRLKLGGLKLQELPAELAQLPNLDSLEIDTTQFEQLPAIVCQLANLSKLTIRDSELRVLPAEIGQLVNLTELTLEVPQLEAFPLEIGQLANLKTLICTQAQFAELPAEIGQLANLTTLSLHDCRLTQLPSEISQLGNLTGLNISSCPLTAVPPEISQLANLIGLSLTSCTITTLPAEIGQLTTLQRLSVNRCPLAELPATIGQLHQLNFVSLDYCALRTLPDTIAQLSNLKQLHVAGNQLAVLPTGIGQLVDLERLDLSHNQFVQFPVALTSLPNLTLLDLSHNQLQELPAEIGELNKLSSLYVNNNQLTKLPLTITRLTYNLLHIGENPWAEFPTEMQAFFAELDSRLYGMETPKEEPDLLAEITQLLKPFGPWIEKYRRSAWQPVVEGPAPSLTASKFLGTPWLPVDAEWPTCPDCSAPMQLLLQIDLNELPQPLPQTFGSGLLQLFGCPIFLGIFGSFTSHEQEGFFFSQIVQPEGVGLTAVIPDEPWYKAGTAIKAWQEIADLPHWKAYHERYNPNALSEFEVVLGGSMVLEHQAGPRLELTEKINETVFEKFLVCATGNKLAGWPYWTQYPEYPDCPICNSKMNYVYQIEWADYVPVDFGDYGVVMIFQCPSHKEVTDWVYQCM
ncbi:MAG: leucine-rich repeat domain-containing protein [Chloroflexota bacterium]